MCVCRSPQCHQLIVQPLAYGPRCRGRAPDTIASALAQPLERQIGTIPGIVEMRSFSATGGTELTVQFQLDKSIDAAAGAVQAAINAAGPSLPKDLPQPPGYWKVKPSGWAVIVAVVDLGRDRSERRL